MKYLFNGFYSILFAVAVFIAIASPVHANRAPRNTFPPTYVFDQTRLKLNGAGTLKYLGVFSIYDGALYLPPDVAPQRALDDVPKRLEVEYLRSFKKEDLGSATIAGIRENVSHKGYARLEERIALHNSLYADIKPGDRVSLTYLPSLGTVVEINGIAQGTIEGADFAHALFSMWLGEKPFDKGFKQALLGES